MEKKVVYESRPKLIALLLVGWGFVIMCLWVRYWSGLVFFGLCAAVTTYRLLDPRKELLFYGTPAYRAHLACELEAWQTNPGDFTYLEDGFRIPSHTGYRVIAWNDLRAVFGYKRDWYATDELCLDIFFQDSSFTITEETAGWHIFVEQLEAYLPLLPGWFGEVAVPAFETRLTLLYEREGRSFAQAMPAYYPADTQPD
ncbi:MAG: hypothetical protein EOO60_03830 [Hymenobacter sp.]|nr:MAG: hypothetical protein EOO60_03830 [Hymenobacter sp.]